MFDEETGAEAESKRCDAVARILYKQWCISSKNLAQGEEISLLLLTHWQEMWAAGFDGLSLQDQDDFFTDAAELLAGDISAKALAWYADPKNHEKRVDPSRGHGFRISDVEEDLGKRARETLGLPKQSNARPR